MEDIAICRLTGSDVVRHVIVQRIIKAYEDDENNKKGETLMNTELKHDIHIDWELAGTNPYKPLLTRVITAALAAENVTIPCSVDVLLTTDEGIREINQEQRNIDQATDVLSFPMLELTPGTPPDGTGEDEQDPETGLCPLGDMVISVDRAKAQAAEFGHSVERELAYLAVHSVLHLLGYDHLDEGPQKAQMRAREEAILEGIGVTRDHFDESLNAPEPRCIRPAGGEALRHDHHLRPPQRGQIHPDQRPGGGEGRHRIQQAPDHPQPHLRRADPGRVPSSSFWTPPACTGRPTAWGTTWSMWSGAAWPTWTPCCCWWSRSPNVGGPEKELIEQIKKHARPLPCWSSTRSTPWKRTQLLAVMAAYSKVA